MVQARFITDNSYHRVKLSIALCTTVNFVERELLSLRKGYQFQEIKMDLSLGNERAIGV